MEEYYLIAEVCDSYGSDGSVIIKSYSDYPERFSDLEYVFFNFFGKIRKLEIEYSERKDELIVLKFRRFDSAEDIQFLFDIKLYVEKDKLYKLPDNSYYIHDLIDSEVYISEKFFGKLIDVLKLPGNDLLIIEQNNGKEIMIPAVKKYIEHFDDSRGKLFLSEESKIFDEDEN